MTLKEWREAHGIKQLALANHLGVTRQTMAAYEDDQWKMNVLQAMKACSFMHAPFDQIFLADDVTTSNVSFSNILTEDVVKRPDAAGSAK